MSDSLEVMRSRAGLVPCQRALHASRDYTLRHFFRACGSSQRFFFRLRRTASAGHPPPARQSRSSLRLRCRSCRKLLQIRQPLFQVEHRRKQIAHLFHARHHLLRFEHQQARIFLLERPLHFLPRHRRRNRGMLARPQRIHRDRGLVLVVLAPVDEHFPGAQLSSSCPTQPSRG